MKGVKAQFNFVWLFAILAGGTILFLAIMGATKAGETAQYQTDTQIAKSIEILTDPLQAGYSSGSYGSIEFKAETRIRNVCSDFTEFGKNDISVATQSDLVQEWSDYAGATSIYSKYIFSSEVNQGTKYYVFSKPFYFPYKVADLTFLMTETYCFKDAPDEIASELSKLQVPNIFVDNCTGADNIVCFDDDSDCDILVIGTCSNSDCESVYDRGRVIKDGKMEYVGNLMYAAIFSDEDNYECNVNRLLSRTLLLSEEYSAKVDIMSARGCSSSLKTHLSQWGSLVNSTTPSEISSQSIFTQLKYIEETNDRESCNLW